jgi:cytochrome c oxidase assembly protein subunit 11
MNKPIEKDKKSKIRDSKVAVACVAFVGAMVGMSYAAVPLYEIFCQVTGYGGTTSRVEQASDVILDQKIKIRCKYLTITCMGIQTKSTRDRNRNW